MKWFKSRERERDPENCDKVVSCLRPAGNQVTEGMQGPAAELLQIWAGGLNGYLKGRRASMQGKLEGKETEMEKKVVGEY